MQDQTPDALLLPLLLAAPSVQCILFFFCIRNSRLLSIYNSLLAHSVLFSVLQEEGRARCGLAAASKTRRLPSAETPPSPAPSRGLEYTRYWQWELFVTSDKQSQNKLNIFITEMSLIFVTFILL